MDEESIYQQEIPMEEDEAFLPDGYAEGDDFFNPESWSGETDAGSAPADETAETDEGTPEDPDTEEAPATGQTEDSGSADDGANDVEDPATVDEPITPSTKRRVRYQFDHEDREEEIDDADLPELLQKARSVDRYKDRINGMQSLRDRLDSTARALKYDSGEAFLDAILENAKTSEMENLRGRGVPDEIAEDYISRKYSGTAAPTPSAQNEPAAEVPSQANARDYKAEALELLRVKPELMGKQLPNEVYIAANEPGKTLLSAYLEYERKAAQAEAEKARSDAEKLRKENRILKNNADSADRAPVSGVSKGGRTDDQEADDPFLRGFNSI